MVNFGLLTAEIRWRVWGTPANFNGFRVLAALLHSILVVGVSEALRRWTEGATYIQQGGHQVGHWPTVVYNLRNAHISSWVFNSSLLWPAYGIGPGITCCVSCSRIIQSSTFWGSHSADAVESKLLGHRLHQHGLCNSTVSLTSCEAVSTPSKFKLCAEFFSWGRQWFYPPKWLVIKYKWIR